MKLSGMDGTLPLGLTGILIGHLMDARACHAGERSLSVSGQRILGPLRSYLPHLTTRYQAVFTDISAVKAGYVRLGIST